MIYTTEGKKLEKMLEHPHGDGLEPLSWDELRGKYETLASSIFPEERVREIERKFLYLEEIKDFNEVAELLAN